VAVDLAEPFTMGVTVTPEPLLEEFLALIVTLLTLSPDATVNV
jgi:hypothetical protein